MRVVNANKSSHTEHIATQPIAITMTHPTNPTSTLPAAAKTFSDFYRQIFLPEHQHTGNIALHVAGTLGSIAFVVFMFINATPWWALLHPVLHALPGLLGHRLWERNAAVGDVRVTRKDYPPLWFIAGNHWMTWDVLTKAVRWRGRGASSEASAPK
jgi:hypothetical protein